MKKKIRVLVVDDEKVIVDSIQLALINDGTITSVSRAVDGKDAFYKIKDHLYDLVILDLNMPHLSGSELIRKVSEIKAYKPIYLIVTGHLEKEGLEELLSLGVKHILTKPFNTKEIVNKVKSITAQIRA